jgi:3-oxoacyl-[acyl-carrier-protein] synthase-3
MAAGGIRRLLLLVGDTSSFVSSLDRSTTMLFGDAGTVTALERDDNAQPWVFEVGTDGSGQNHLIVPAGRCRQPSTESTRRQTEREGGNIRSDEHLFMNGAEVFAFTLREVPPLVKSVLSNAEWSLESVDAFVMHQANRFMLQHLAKKMKLPMDKVVVALEEYGNTSSASVPLAMTHTLAKKLKSSELRLLLAGFGVGWSWGAVALTCGLMVMPELVVVPNSALFKQKLEVTL